jgi:hypothetical protein
MLVHNTSTERLRIRTLSFTIGKKLQDILRKMHKALGFDGTLKIVSEAKIMPTADP